MLPNAPRVMASIVPLSAIDPSMVEQLLDATFGEGRKARTAYRIREGAKPLDALSFAALDDGDYLAATIQAWPTSIVNADGRSHPLIMVGPVAVLPQNQGEGFGKALMARLLGALDSEGLIAPPQFLIGDLDYYGQWGFSAGNTGGWQCPGPWDPGRLLVRAANPAILPPAGMLGPWTDNLADREKPA